VQYIVDMPTLCVDLLRKREALGKIKIRRKFVVAMMYGFSFGFSSGQKVAGVRRIQQAPRLWDMTAPDSGSVSYCADKS
jgi:hypothetical protein